ncbi:MAG TPA: hypothetical protein DEP45_04970 [Armatimonadetes bacterium]|nr:hypothetical protein [Armatimonadota bacterium]
MRFPGTAGWMMTLMAVVALVAVALMGCPPEEEATDDTVVTPVPDADAGPPGEETTEAPAAAGDEEVVQVTLLDGKIEMPDALPSGPTTFEVTNSGQMLHNFEIEGRGIEEELESDLTAGQSGTLSVDLQPGAYEVYCPVANHADQGMRMTLTVTEASAEATE